MNLPTFKVQTGTKNLAEKFSFTVWNANLAAPKCNSGTAIGKSNERWETQQ